MSWNMPVLLGALAVATEQNQRAIGRLLADRKFEDMPELPDAINPMEAAFAEAKGKLTPPHPTSLTTTTWPTRSAVPSWKASTR